ncbi:hypothetical protein BD289DRAFT_480517 [Coniella lustricola]|uniref:Lysyl-tRNA synthetase n=1 Tax=Coniella lustricola TaxID=2025994 RepID=A0A2T3AFL8_9PEZI|nr:hypothetical protein BD289DRAFT_480517 [Coniella lustricola]
MAPRLRFLRPYALQPLCTATPAQRSAYVRFYELARAEAALTCRRHKSFAPSGQDEGDYSPEERGALLAARVKELRPAGGLDYPRLTQKGRSITLRAYIADFESRGALDLASVTEQYTLCGRVLHVRRHGSKFFFIKIVQDGVQIQAMVNLGKMTDGTDAKQFKAVSMLLKRGDHVSITGKPARSDSMELSIQALHCPQLLSPSLVPLPFQTSQETRMHNRHIDLLLNRSARDILLVRSFIINHLREHLHKTLRCTEVQTPILAANAGGAVARPFSTRATEFTHRDLAMRIAPELWLKRLVVGGFDRVFEIGQSFRNEGIDATHNPEFTTCEFYLSYTNLDSLLNITQNLIFALARGVNAVIKKKELQLEGVDASVFEQRFDRVEFIPALEEALGQPLPKLDSSRAVSDIIKLIEDAGKDWHRSLPPNPSLSKLLDHMAAEVIEPRSQGRPLYIINHPVCMSPLAKSFTCPTTGQQVAARAELFFDGNELANMYEEENDPFKQRRKFLNQARAKLAEQGGEVLGEDEDPPHVIDEQYISVLESGLPPTGGWGCGIDRLVMLFTGAKRISDVLPFGNLRNVVGLASVEAQGHHDSARREAMPTAPVTDNRKQNMTVEQPTASEQKDAKAGLGNSEQPSSAPSAPPSSSSGLDAFSAASFLRIAEDVPEIRTSNSDGMTYKRHVPQFIEKQAVAEKDVVAETTEKASEDEQVPGSEKSSTN